jgi:predicted negative regulator of RcsB-dependent stress response
VLTLVAALAMSQLDPLLHAASAPALQAHNACRKKDLAQCPLARERYEQFLREFPGSVIDTDMKFFLAELLNDNLEDHAAAELLYRDVARAPPNKWSRNAALNRIFALLDVVEKRPYPGGPPMTPRERELIEACDELLARFPDTDRAEQVAFKAARVAYTANALNEAEDRLRRLIASTPTSTDAVALYGDLLEYEGDVHRFAAEARWVRRVAPGAASGLDDYLRKAIGDLQSQGRTAEAAELAVELALNLRSDEAFLRAARLYVSVGELEHAVEALEHARAPSAEALTLRALLLARLGKAQAAAQLFEQAEAAGRDEEAAREANARAPSRSRTRHH